MDKHTCVKLNCCHKMPIIGYHANHGNKTKQRVREALEAGYCSIDTDHDLEEAVGQAIVESGKPRKDLFITAKLEKEDIRSGRIREALQASLQALQSDYIDLYLLHGPAEGYQEAYEIMEECMDEGLIHSIGVADFQISHLEALMAHAHIIPSVNQLAYDPYRQDDQTQEYCHENKIVLVNSLPERIGEDFYEPVIQEIARDVQRSYHQVVLRWLLQKGIVVLSQENDDHGIKEDMALFDFSLNERQMQVINALHKKRIIEKEKTMKQFEFYMPAHVLFGAGQLAHLHEQVMPGKKALIITSQGQSTKKYGYLERVEKELEQAGIKHVLFDKIRSNPSASNVMEGAQAVKENQCDFVVALGGGSVIDCTKCIALMATNTGHIWDYSLSKTGSKKVPEHEALPIIAITTSAGTGSEVDIAAVITNDETKEKTGIFFPSMFPKLSIVDADLMMSVPPHFTAYQGMDAFFHASETVINKNVHPMAEMFALKAIELIAKSLPIAYQDGQNKQAREDMALANSLAGYYMMCTSAHTMEHVMGSDHNNLIHGAGLIMIAHSYYDYFASRKASEIQMVKMAKAMGYEEAATGKDFIKALDDLIACVGCQNLKMSEAGITREELKNFPEKMHEVLGGDMTADPLLLTDEDYLTLFEDAYQ